MSTHEIHPTEEKAAEERSEQPEKRVHYRTRSQSRQQVKETCATPAYGDAHVPTCEAIFSAFSLLQEKWVLFIVHSLLHSPMGFNELSRRARGVNTTTLTQRLMLLEEHGLVKRTVYSMMPPRTIYELTESGLALREVIEAIGHWGEQYLQDKRVCNPDQ